MQIKLDPISFKLVHPKNSKKTKILTATEYRVLSVFKDQGAKGIDLVFLSRVLYGKATPSSVAKLKVSISNIRQKLKPLKILIECEQSIYKVKG